MQINQELRLSTIALGNFATGGVIGTAAATVDVCAAFTITQTTAGQTLSLPTPSNATQTVSTIVINKGTAPFTVHGITLPTDQYTQLEWNGTAWCAQAPAAAPDLYKDGGKANTIMTLSGVATVTAANELSWTYRFIILGGGRGAAAGAASSSSAGFFEISMPPVGTVITGVGGASDVTVTAAGIPLVTGGTSGGWTALWYQLPEARTPNFVAANLRIAGFTSDFGVPSDWVLVAARNADSSTVRLGNGQIVAAGSTSAPPTSTVPMDFWRDGGRPAQLLTAAGNITYTANGELTWGGRIIALGGGAGNGLNGAAYSAFGYYDINMPPVGTVITGVGGSVGNLTVTAAGIPLTSWGTLYYKLSGGGAATVNSNFIWVGYGSNYTVTPDMIALATVNQDAATFVRLGTGFTLNRGESVVNNKVQVPWTNVTFVAPWVNYNNGYQTAQYRKVGDKVELRGLVRGGTNFSTIFNLPAGFRPPAQILLSTQTDTNVAGRIDVLTNGQVYVQSGSTGWISLDNLSFSTI